MGGGRDGTTLRPSGCRRRTVNGASGLDPWPRGGAGRNASGALWVGEWRTASNRLTVGSVKYTVYPAPSQLIPVRSAPGWLACKCAALDAKRCWWLAVRPSR